MRRLEQVPGDHLRPELAELGRRQLGLQQTPVLGHRRPQRRLIFSVIDMFNVLNVKI